MANGLTANPFLVATYAGSPCGVLTEEYGSLNGTSYATNYTTIFDRICTTSQFVASYDAGLNSSGEFLLGLGGEVGEVPQLYFTLSRTSECTIDTLGNASSPCIFETFWTGYLGNDSFSGPTFAEYPAFYSGAPVSVSTNPSVASYQWLLIASGLVAAGLVAGATAATVRKDGALGAALQDPSDGESAQELYPAADLAPLEVDGGLDDIF